VNSLGTGLETNLTLDGRTIQTMTLNSAKVEILEFRRGGNHTLELTPIILVARGIRFAVTGTPWTFSSGGKRSFEYHLQFFLQVISAHGDPTGTGWYDANSTAVASVASADVDGYEFRGWAGSMSSTSPTVEITMNSSKQLVAQWDASVGTASPIMAESMPLIVAVAVGTLALVAVYLVISRGKAKRGRTRTY
jgi:hypothetical protein